MRRAGIFRAALACCVGAVLICGLAPAAKAADERARFTDVPADAWYHDSANFCYEAGVFVGDQAGRFQPQRVITPQEGYAILARLHQAHTGSAQSFIVAPGEDWSEPYLRYCLEHQILSEAEAAASAPLNRERFVQFLSRIYDGEDFQKINPVTSLPDYTISTDLGQFALTLYQAGVLSGTDLYGRFSPLAELSRAECATIIMRLLSPETRSKLETPQPLKMKLAFLTASDTVYDFDGAYLYLVDDSEDAPLYRVSDLYWRVVLTSEERVSRQKGGIFRIDDPDLGATSYYNAQGDLVFSSPKLMDPLAVFSHGKLAVKQEDGSILVVDARGNTLGTVEDMGNYRVIGPAFGDYIPVAPESGRKDGYSYWLDFYAGTVKELPYTVEWSLSDIGQGYLVVKSYDETAGRWVYNALDPSLELVFPQMMDEVQVYANGDLRAENHGLYYTQAPGAEMEVSSSGIAKTVTIGGDHYTVVGRKLIHPHMVNGETRIDLLDEHGALEQAGISADQIWYGELGQILYCFDSEYVYISA